MSNSDYKEILKEELLEPKISIHEGVRFPCEQCDYKATRRGHLLRHKQLIHEGVIVMVPCDQCDYKAKEKRSLTKHIKSRHHLMEPKTILGQYII